MHLQRKFLLAAILLAATARPGLAQTPEPASLVLSCAGRATFTIPNLNRDENGRYKDDKRVDTAGRVRLRVEGDTIAVRLPSGVPGGDVWRKADRSEITADHLSGVLKYGLLSSVHFEVDRRTGDIDLSGVIAFSGNCEKAPDVDQPRKF